MDIERYEGEQSQDPQTLCYKCKLTEIEGLLPYVVEIVRAPIEVFDDTYEVVWIIRFNKPNKTIVDKILQEMEVDYQIVAN